MLRKLLKYEFKATSRIFLPLFAALLAVSAVNRFLSSLNMDVPSGIGQGVAVILIIGICAAAFVLILQSFWNRLLAGEGYLMLTLPVSADKLILSRLIVSTAWILISALVVTASAAVMSFERGVFFKMLFDGIMPYDAAFREVWQNVIVRFEVLIVIILSIFTMIQMIYACMSLGMLVNRHRGLFAFGAFAVVAIVLQILFWAYATLANILEFSGIVTFFPVTAFGRSQFVILYVIIPEAIAFCVFYLITRFMLKKRLNIQ